VNSLAVTKAMAAVGVPGGKTGKSKAMRWLKADGGWAGTMRGVQLSATRAFVHYGVMFTTYNQLSRFLVDKPDGAMSTYSLVGTFVAGSVSGGVATLLTHPLDVAKTRVMVASFAGTTAAYKGVSELGVVAKTLAEEGVYNGIYRGLGVGLVGSAIFSGILLTGLELADNVPWLRRNKPMMNGSVERVYWMSTAATIAVIAVHPIDVIRHKYMAQSTVLPNGGGVDIKFATLQECVKNIYRANGVFGYFHGIYSTVLRVLPQTAIFVALYSTGKSLTGLPTIPHIVLPSR
jgi:hypothetical protein